MATFAHTPVLLAAVLDMLPVQPGDVLLDGTLGGGGHAAALLHRALPGGHLFGIDADPAALTAARERLIASGAPPTSFTLVHGNSGDVQRIAAAHGIADVAAVLLDLGVSSYQLDTPERGFSFQVDAPLDMRLDPTQGETAADLLARLSERDLADVLYHYGEERASRRIARVLVAERQHTPLTRTGQLATLVARVRGVERRRGIHPATRTFQALRIAVNRELDTLPRALHAAAPLLKIGGRLAVISFHSLEDRIVKQFLRAASGYGGQERPPGVPLLRQVVRKPVVPDDDEQRSNPRSRSARLRVAERIDETPAPDDEWDDNSDEWGDDSDE